MYTESVKTMESLLINIRGLVQGIGFRPFVYLGASRFGIKGHVRNRSDSVSIVAQGPDQALSSFLKYLRENPPPLARMESFTVDEADTEPCSDFRILESEDNPGSVTDISPDLAVCDLCLQDIKEQSHRVNYPFVNCTLCGPRFSIINGVPYDRGKTTMAPFQMCRKCASEYQDITDRRFHAQPVACNDCGPVYSLFLNNKCICDIDQILENMARLLQNGSIVAMKGTGGFHLACSPLLSGPLSRLRSGKRRDGKPFALMFRDLDTVKEYAEADSLEEQLLLSSVRPIVLLKEKKKFADEVNSGLGTIGVMLPYMPFHFMLFEKLSIPALVMTSGNLSEEPIIIDNDTALDQFTGIADAVLTYNRDIYNRLDDSVTAVFSGEMQTFRRSRGLVPSPVTLPWDVEGIMAVGAELKNCFVLGKGNKAILSQHIGDLKNAETFSFYKESLQRFKSMFRVDPEVVACDLHPDYLSSVFARETGLPIEEVQHHHAHIASCMAEHGLEEPVIGVAFDGTGLGSDGAVWGGEFLLCDLKDFTRFTHLRYTGMPGGDRAAVEPWRMAVSYLYDMAGSSFMDKYGRLLEGVDPEHIQMAVFALEKNIHCPKTSSAGRLFDAVSAILGLCTKMSFEAEGAMRLEACSNGGLSHAAYPWTMGESIDLRPALSSICTDMLQGKAISDISGRFHMTIVDVIEKTCLAVRKERGFKKVVLSGGCFQNRCIFELSRLNLENAGFVVYTHSLVPCNDGGVALGQLAVAASRRR